MVHQNQNWCNGREKEKLLINSAGVFNCQPDNLSVADFIVVGTDSGRIVILEYLAAKNAFEKVARLMCLPLAT